MKLVSYIFLVIGLIGMVQTSQAQQFQNVKGDYFESPMFFRTSFMKTNKIKSMRGKISSKKDLRPIKYLGLFEEYRFNEAGQYTYKLATRTVDKQTDSTVIQFIYDPNGRLKAEISTDDGGFQKYSYTYTEKGNIASKAYSKEVITGSKDELHIAKEVQISSERYEYTEETDSTYRGTLFNNENRPYKDLYYKSDKYGAPSNEWSKYSVNRKGEEVLYLYDENYRLSERLTSSNVWGNKSTKILYKYDEHGRLLEELKYKNDALIYTVEYLYYSDSGLLKARLVREEETKSIRIIEFTYTYW